MFIAVPLNVREMRHLDSNQGKYSVALSANFGSMIQVINASDSLRRETTVKLGFNQSLVKL